MVLTSRMKISCATCLLVGACVVPMLCVGCRPQEVGQVSTERSKEQLSEQSKNSPAQDGIKSVTIHVKGMTEQLHLY